MVQDIIKELKELTELLENMKRIKDDDRTADANYYKNCSMYRLRELSYKVGTLFEGRKPMKDSHRTLREALEKKVKAIIKHHDLNEYVIGVSVSFVSAPPVNFEGPDWESDAITNLIEIRIAFECGLGIKDLEWYKNAFGVTDDSVCMAGHQYGKMEEQVFNSDWIVDLRMIIRRKDFEELKVREN